MRSLVARTARESGRLLLALLLMGALFVAGASTAAWYSSRPMHSFCDGVSDKDSSDAVIARATSQGFPVFDVIDRRGVVAVLNHRPFWFRYSCEIEFEDGQLVGKRVISAD